jgi:DNA adenine methylase
MSLIRYPGSKAKIAKQLIMRWFPDATRPGMELWQNQDWEYREPFFGAGAIGFKILDWLGKQPNPRAWVNDIDFGLTCLWQTVLEAPDQLCDMIATFMPNAEDFYRFKELDGEPAIDYAVTGFRKLALHTMSFSGLGAMAGGPLGGKEQANAKYPVGCRWNAERLQEEVWELHDILARFPRHNLRITCKDFVELFKGAGRNVFIYCDPPYYEKGPQLYKYAMMEADHIRLRDACRGSQCQWVLSYDDHPKIREWYADYEPQPVASTYTIAVGPNVRRKNQEIVICGAA